MSVKRQRGGKRELGRYGWSLLLALGLLPGGGCLTTPTGKTGVPEGPPSGGSQTTALPPDAGSRVCLSLAASYEREAAACCERDEKKKFLECAIQQYARAREQDPSLKVSRQLAVLLDQLGEQRLAQKEFQNALEQSPHDADLLNNYGYFYYNWGKMPEAEEKLRAALQINAKHQRAWNNLGLVLGANKRDSESLEAFRQAVGSEAEAHSNLAFVMSARGEVAGARKEYHEALRLDPSLTRARLALDKLDNPGKAAPSPLTQVEAARAKAAQERLLARTQPQQPVAAVEPARRTEPPPIVVTPSFMRTTEPETRKE
jgi:tetratricopeptide (TPR) repeat protein